MSQQQNNQSHLLIVDDEELNRDLTALNLLKLGYLSSQAADGIQALELIDKVKFDLILLDISMPNMDGIEVLQRLRAKYSPLELPVIMVTAEDDVNYIIKALEKGANDYLVKPLNIKVTDARIKTQLALSGLLKLKNDFLSFTSHDLKKPLMMMEDIISEVNTNLNKDKIDKKDTEELTGLLANITRDMQNVIKGFLDNNALTSGGRDNNFASININDLIKIILDKNANYSKQKGIRLTSNLNNDIPVIISEPFHVSQIIDNLVGNAIKFSPTDTTITLNSESNAGMIQISITDMGPGFTESDLKLLFEENVTITNRPTGNEESSGIGLPLCKSLINHIEGEIGAYNNKESGATFWIKLPIVNSL